MDLAIMVITHQASFPPGEKSAFAHVPLQSPGAKSAQCLVSKSKHKETGYIPLDSHCLTHWAFPPSGANASDPRTQLSVYCKKGECAASEMISTSPHIVPNSRQHGYSVSSVCVQVPLELFPGEMNLCVSLLLSPSCQGNVQQAPVAHTCLFSQQRWQGRFNSEKVW